MAKIDDLDKRVTILETKVQEHKERLDLHATLLQDVKAVRKSIQRLFYIVIGVFVADIVLNILDLILPG